MVDTDKKSETTVPIISASAGKTERVLFILLSEDEWKKRLTPHQYEATRRKRTEYSFNGRYFNTRDLGIYRRICCRTDLFNAKAKIHSGTGWPSFFEPTATQNIRTMTDSRQQGVRTEVLCAQCDAHPGHVFPDGPASTGMRYCMNSAALDFLPADPSGSE